MNCRLEDLDGEAGRFRASVVVKPRFVDPKKCTGCGECAKHCPVAMPDAYNERLAARKAIYVEYAQAVPLVYRIDQDYCIGCGLCEKVCLANAVNYADAERQMSIEVGSVILATGTEIFDPTALFDYAFQRHPNVITSLQFERILSAGGPYKGHLQRPSDRAHPRKIAFLQCVGSRDERQRSGYCSSVCCMYAIKEAIIAREHSHTPLDCAVFYMDIRAHGKGFDRYQKRAEEEFGVRFVRSKVFNVEPLDGTGSLVLKYLDSADKPVAEEFDMVVLSSGFRISQQAVEVAKRLRISLDDYGFARTDSFAPGATTRPGVFVCGAFGGPKDIPESVTEASAAAACASELLAPARKTLVTKVEYPEEKDVSAEPLRIGVFVCHCGINIANTVDVTAVKEYAKTLPGVVHAEQNLYTCSQDAQEHIKQVILEHNLNRVIVASCSPRTHEPIFRETVRQAGLNPYLFEMANIRDQCSWVHMNEPAKATRKAKRLVKMAVAKASLLESLKAARVSVTPSALVVGGGVAGMTAANNLANQGFQVYLIEKERELGGTARHLRRTIDGRDIQEFLATLISKTMSHPRIEVITGATIVEIAGRLGSLETGYMREPRKDILRIHHGVAIVATGAVEHKPQEYLYGQHPCVMTQLELEQKLAAASQDVMNARTIVMIQCVGSRDESRMYCSRVCCAQAVKNALWLKQINPDATVFVLYRDMRTYGLAESYYRKAREAGVVFIRYDLANKPIVMSAVGGAAGGQGGAGGRDSLRLHSGQACRATAAEPTSEGKTAMSSVETPSGSVVEIRIRTASVSERLRPETTQQPLPYGRGSEPCPSGSRGVTVQAHDPILGGTLDIHADLLVLAPAMVSPGESSLELSHLLKVPVDKDGFFMEAHVKLRPVDFATEGAFVCGLAHSPKSLDECIAQANAAASRAATILSKTDLQLEAALADVIDQNCDGCAYCVDPCPYKAITLIEYMVNGEVKKTVDVDESKCKGCGTCQATCPKRGIVVRHFKMEQILAMIEAALS